MLGLSAREERRLRRLSTPAKIQDFLDELPINFEIGAHTYLSPRRVLRERRAHCFEGALLAATALWLHGEPPRLLDLKTIAADQDHVVALYQRGGRWGAISKTNHATLRFRDPIFSSSRDLALSYFHEYFINKTGEKTLRSYSRTFDLRRFGTSWIIAEENLDYLAEALDFSRHYPLVSQRNFKFVRRADKMERRAGSLLEWPKPH